MMSRRWRYIAALSLPAVVVVGFLAVRGDDSQPVPVDQDKTFRTATFAGGCFWCMERPFDELEGVLSTTVGYTGGRTEEPTYEQVSSGRTGHLEAIAVRYDPQKISYQDLLDVFWHNVDPTQKGGQFCDEGSQYRSAIFYHDQDEKQAAEASKRSVGKELGKKIVTDILPVKTFWPAEDYHQDYYIKNPLRYKYYRYSCGRDQRLQAVWGDRAGH